MSETAEFVVRAILIGTARRGDGLWTEVRKRVFNAPSLDYALVGRWLGIPTADRA